jgi:hypothetical protein
MFLRISDHHFMRMRETRHSVHEPIVILMSGMGIPEFIAVDSPTHVCTGSGWKNLSNPNHRVGGGPGYVAHADLGHPQIMPELPAPPVLLERPVVVPELTKSAAAEPDLAPCFVEPDFDDVLYFPSFEDSDAWIGYDSSFDIV